MAKKRKPDYDEDEGYAPEPPKEDPALQLFNPQLVETFANNYMPVDSENIATTVMTRGMIREYFGAYAMDRIGDPIHLYIKELSAHGFVLRPSLCGEMALFLRYHSKDVRDASFSKVLPEDEDFADEECD